MGLSVQNIISKRVIYLLFILLITDLSYSFVQHLKMPLDGDMAECILPSKELQKIFEDPLGLTVISKNAVYPNHNRFFVQ